MKEKSIETYKLENMWMTNYILSKANDDKHDNVPSPAAYNPEKSCASNKSPSFTFGLKVFYQFIII